jgi:hypothetical protein
VSIFTPEIATTIGALDSDAFTSGAAFSAHLLRELIRSANRAASKEQCPILNLLWPEGLVSLDDPQARFEGVAPPTWTRILPAMLALKRPRLNLATLWFRASVPSAFVLEVYVATTRRPWRESVAADLTITGSGAYTDYTLTDIPISEGEEEYFEIWVRGQGGTTLTSTATYGDPSRRSLASPLGIYEFAGNDQISLSTANWNTTSGGSADHATAGHYVNFEDANGDPVIPPRAIVDVPGTTNLLLDPPLSARERVLADPSGQGDFSIYEFATYAISQIGFKAQARTDAGAALISPYHGHSNAGATAEALRKVLSKMREHARTHARYLGTQTYALFLRNQKALLDASWGLLASDWVDIASYEDVVIPAACRRILVHFPWHLALTDVTTVHLRILVTDGTNTDTGTDSPVVREVPAEPGVKRNGYAIWNPGEPTNGDSYAEVVVSAARVVGTPAARTITIQAFADGAGRAQRIQPGPVSAWWTE